MPVNKKFKILIYPGLHARPGSEFVKLCQSYQSSVTINVDDKTANGKSLLSLFKICLLYTSPSPRDKRQSRMPSSA